MVTRPTADDVREYIRVLGFEPNRFDSKAIIEEFENQDELLSKLDELGKTGEPPDRDYWNSEDDPLGAFLTRCRLDPTGEGSLSGMEVGIKDNIAVAGVPMTCGSPILHDFIPPDDATVISRLRQEGASIVGKTNMDEFAAGGDDSTMRFRIARNPHDPDHHPGSSSLGSGIAVAEGTVDLALGSDTGGSVRLPAAWSGIVGVKPTRGLVPLRGFVQYARTLDTIGILSSQVNTAAAGLEAIANPYLGDTTSSNDSAKDYTQTVEQARELENVDMVIGLPAEMFGNSPELDDIVLEAVSELESAGAKVQKVSLPDFDVALPAWLAIAITEFGAYIGARGLNYWSAAKPPDSLRAALEKGLTERKEDLGNHIVEAWLYAHHLRLEYGNRYYALAQYARRRLTEVIGDVLKDVDVLASPTIPTRTPRIEDGFGDLVDVVGNTGPFNLTGHPAISLPVGAVEGLPVGIQFVADLFDETTLFQAATHWESHHT